VSSGSLSLRAAEVEFSNKAATANVVDELDARGISPPQAGSVRTRGARALAGIAGSFV
jgi:hypothetical protein